MTMMVYKSNTIVLEHNGFKSLSISDLTNEQVFEIASALETLDFNVDIWLEELDSQEKPMNSIDYGDLKKIIPF
jgi:hypothetical protein